MRAQSARHIFCEVDNINEATEICNAYNWEFQDENGFVWELEIDD